MKDVGVEDLKGGEDGRTLHPALQEVDDHQGDQVAGHGQVARLVDALGPGNQRKSSNDELLERCVSGRTWPARSAGRTARTCCCRRRPDPTRLRNPNHRRPVRLKSGIVTITF